MYGISQNVYLLTLLFIVKAVLQRGFWSPDPRQDLFLWFWSKSQHDNAQNVSRFIPRHTLPFEFKFFFKQRIGNIISF